MKLSKIDCWKIHILECEKHPLEEMNISGNEILRFNHFESIHWFTSLKKSIIIEGDPFLFIKDEKLYVFYESKILAKDGVIKMTSTYDVKTWTPPVTVLKESCHLSFPFVFEDNGTVYMIPETCALNSIRLYKALDNGLTQWEYVKTLVKENGNLNKGDSSFCDSSIVLVKDTYYLFTTLIRDKINELHVYTSHSLSELFISHPCNPIIRDNHYGRNAGSIVFHDNTLWRVSQQCSKSYGENVNVHKIVELSPTDYKEIIVKEELFDRKVRTYVDGGHQLNVVKFKNQFIVATDAKGYRKILFTRLISKVYNRLKINGK